MSGECIDIITMTLNTANNQRTDFTLFCNSIGHNASDENVPHSSLNLKQLS